jgi:hypothetical protein
MGDDEVRSYMDFEPDGASRAELVFDDVEHHPIKLLERQTVITAHSVGTFRRRLEAEGQGQIAVAEELQPDIRIAEKRNIGDQRDQMAFGLKQVQDLIDFLVKEGLAEDVEEDGNAEAEGMDLVEELSQPRFRKMLLRPAQDV